MVATGELIRSMNYVDDIAATLRRIVTASAMMTDEERKRLAEYMRNSDPNFIKVVEQLASGK
jgi:deoxyribose-phosphate aldolase